ncbi:MAG: invasion associated locus B family protein [Pseudomonadota bacterium]
MRNLLSAGLIAVSCALPGFAQEASDDGAQSDAAAAADAAFPIVNGGAQGPEPDGVFGDWELRCFGEEEPRRCLLSQFARTAEGEVLAQMRVEALPEGAQAAGGVTIIGPLGVLLTAGLTMQIDDGRINRYPFAVCERDGCLARFGITPTEVEVMKAGATATLAVVAAQSDGSPVPLAISLDQFTAAWDALQAEQ